MATELTGLKRAMSDYQAEAESQKQQLIGQLRQSQYDNQLLADDCAKASMRLEDKDRHFSREA